MSIAKFPWMIVEILLVHKFNARDQLLLNSKLSNLKNITILHVIQTRKLQGLCHYERYTFKQIVTVQQREVTDWLQHRWGISCAKSHNYKIFALQVYTGGQDKAMFQDIFPEDWPPSLSRDTVDPAMSKQVLKNIAQYEMLKKKSFLYKYLNRMSVWNFGENVIIHKFYIVVWPLSVGSWFVCFIPPCEWL